MKQPPRVIPKDFRYPVLLVRSEFRASVQTFREVARITFEFCGHLVMCNPPVFERP